MVHASHTPALRCSAHSFYKPVYMTSGWQGSSRAISSTVFALRRGVSLSLSLSHTHAHTHTHTHTLSHTHTHTHTRRWVCRRKRQRKVWARNRESWKAANALAVVVSAADQTERSKTWTDYRYGDGTGQEKRQIISSEFSDQ